MNKNHHFHYQRNKAVNILTFIIRVITAHAPRAFFSFGSISVSLAEERRCHLFDCEDYVRDVLQLEFSQSIKKTFSFMFFMSSLDLLYKWNIQWFVRFMHFTVSHCLKGRESPWSLISFCVWIYDGMENWSEVSHMMFAVGKSVKTGSSDDPFVWVARKALWSTSTFSHLISIEKV